MSTTSITYSARSVKMASDIAAGLRRLIMEDAKGLAKADDRALVTDRDVHEAAFDLMGPLVNDLADDSDLEGGEA